MATGFHGFHVIVGTIFLTVCLIRAMRRRFHAEAAFRLRGGRLVLALRRRGVAVPVHLHLCVGRRQQLSGGIKRRRFAHFAGGGLSGRPLFVSSEATKMGETSAAPEIDVARRDASGRGSPDAARPAVAASCLPAISRSLRTAIRAVSTTSFADSGDGPAVFVILVTGFMVDRRGADRRDALRAALLAARAAVGSARHHPAAHPASRPSRACSSRCNSGTRPKRASWPPNKAATMRTKGLVGLTACMLAGSCPADRAWRLAAASGSHWKEGLIAEIETRAKGEPITPQRGDRRGPRGQGSELLPGAGRRPLRQCQGALSLLRVRERAGWHVITPLTTTDGAVLVDRGFVPDASERSLLARSRRA